MILEIGLILLSAILIEEDTNKWKDIPCSRIGRVSTAKISILFKADYRLNAVPINIPIVVFKVIEQF